MVDENLHFLIVLNFRVRVISRHIYLLVSTLKRCDARKLRQSDAIDDVEDSIGSRCVCKVHSILGTSGLSFHSEVVILKTEFTRIHIIYGLN